MFVHKSFQEYFVARKICREIMQTRQPTVPSSDAAQSTISSSSSSFETWLTSNGDRLCISRLLLCQLESDANLLRFIRGFLSVIPSTTSLQRRSNDTFSSRLMTLIKSSWSSLDLTHSQTKQPVSKSTGLSELIQHSSPLHLPLPSELKNRITPNDKYIPWQSIASSNAITSLCAGAGHRILSGVDLNGISIPYANLIGCNLSGSTLRGADLRHVQLRGASLVNTDMSQSRCEGLKFGMMHAFLGHTGSVTSVSWSPDGHRLASASWDKSIRVWDSQTGQVLNTLHGHIEHKNRNIIGSTKSNGRSIHNFKFFCKDLSICHRLI